MKYQFWKEENKKKTFMIAGIVIILCLGIIINVQMKRNQSVVNPNAAAKVQTTVDVLKVPRTGLIKRISLTGQTVPEAQVDIAAKYQGKVVAVYSELGQQVMAGEVLIVQDTGDADISIRQNQAAYSQASADAVTSEVSFHANYDKANSDYQRAVTDYQRYKTLYEQGAISRQALDTNEQSMVNARATLDALVNQMNASAVPATIESARAAALRAQQGVNAVEKQREDLVLRAPRSGVIGYRQVEVGSMVSPGQKILSIVDNSKLYVDCQVSEQDLVALTTGMGITVQIESLGQTFQGQIIYISPANDSTNQSFTIRIALTNPNPAIKSGMFAKAVVNAVLRPNALVVPKDAVLEKNGRYYVFIINSQNAAEERTVQPGLKGDQTVEILSGLNEGEQIAVSNLSRLRSGLVIVPNYVTQNDRGDNQ